MKRIILFFYIFLLIFPMTVTAENGVAITVVIPQSETVKEPPAPEPVPTPAVKYLYPVRVDETHENGRHEIVKTYELAKGEKPEDISREAFVRDNYVYELADITKKETSSTDTREYIELVEQSGATNEAGEILKLFDKSYEFINENGYKGTMTLDISTLKVEPAGTKTNAFTVTATREYPHLSSNDASLVPKSITDNGRAYTLSNIQWRTQNTVTIDSDQLPDSYTAVATYTRTAYSTTVTGYTATAEYRGTLSKTLTGKTLYTAYYIGIPIAVPTDIIPTAEPETTAEPTAEPSPAETEEDTTVELTTEPVTESETIELEIFIESVTESTSETETTAEPNTIAETEPKQKPFSPIPVVIIIIAAVGLIGGFVYIFIIRKKGSVSI